MRVTTTLVYVGIVIVTIFTIQSTVQGAIAPIPVTGTILDGLLGILGTFTGTFQPTNFITQGGALRVVGKLLGTLTDTKGNVIKIVTETIITLPVSTAGSCDILNLTLGPLDLNLLGLHVQLNTIHLDISATQGAGQLLGNLLCSIANLLNGGLTSLLNTLLKAL